MASIVSAGTTSATALNMSADTSGVLQLASNNGTVAVTVDTAQNVGIGTATTNPVGSGRNLAVNSGSGTSSWSLSSAGTLGMYAYTDGTNGTFSVYPSGYMAFNTANTERARIDSSVLSLTGLQGIKFQATQSPSSNANTLDDYEEGTWTPAFIVTYGSSSWGSYSVQSGRYVKVGRLVYCAFAVAASSFSVGGNIGVSGLPFEVDPNSYAMTGGAREQAQTGYFYQAEGVSSTQIGVLRRYDNGGLPNGSVSMSGFLIYIATT